MEKVSRYFGVNWDNRKNKWIARVSFEGKRIFVGQFNSDEEAFKAINTKKKELNLTEQNINEVTPLDGEIFRKVGSFPNLEVSNLGRVISFSKGTKRLLIQHKTIKGYYIIKSLRIDGKLNSRSVHLLVAEAFLNHISDGTHEYVVDHIDSDKLNNKLTNLQVITQRKNSNKSIRKNKTSEYAGVCFTKMNKFKSSIHFQGKSISLGYFDSENEASEYYQNALKAIENGEEIVVKRSVYSSKHKGVTWSNQLKKWRAVIWLNSKNNHIGYFLKEDDARIAIEEYISKLNSNQ